MATRNQLATLAAGATAVATIFTPEIRTWWIAGPAWTAGVVFGLRWSNDASRAHVESEDCEPQAGGTQDASSTLAMLKQMGVRFDRPVIDADQPRLTWHQLEDRFRLISGEVQAIWEHDESG